MVSIFFEVDNPTLNIKKMHMDSPCISAEIMNHNNNSIELHFDDKNGLMRFLDIIISCRDTLTTIEQE